MSNLCKIVVEFSLIVIICNVADSIDDCVSIVPYPSELQPLVGSYIKKECTRIFESPNQAFTFRKIAQKRLILNENGDSPFQRASIFNQSRSAAEPKIYFFNSLWSLSLLLSDTGLRMIHPFKLWTQFQFYLTHGQPPLAPTQGNCEDPRSETASSLRYL